MEPPASPRLHRRSHRFALIAAILTATSLAFSPALQLGFVDYDDAEYVTQNSHVQNGLTAESVLWSFRSLEYFNWHPLTWLSLELDATLHGKDASGFHLTNVLLHSAAAVLLFLALERMTGAAGKNACVALLLPVHPTCVESVGWVAERKDVLSGFFWMAALYAYAIYAEKPDWKRYLAVATTLALGLMAKSMLVTLPIVFCLLDYWPLRRVT